jgi:hypothetical protein
MKKDQAFVLPTAVWFERYIECSRTYDTPEFVHSVKRFYRSLLDLDKTNEDNKIMTKTNNFYFNEWKPKVDDISRRKSSYTTDIDTIESIRKEVESEYIYELFDFIKQIIQFSEAGWGVLKYNKSEAWDYDDAIK